MKKSEQTGDAIGTDLVGPLPIPTCWGTFRAFYTRHGLVRLQFPNDAAESLRPLQRVPEPIRWWHAGTAGAVRQVLQGRTPGPDLPPLDWNEATPFQRSVWTLLCHIPPGEVWTYGELARKMGSPRAARAVGQACRTNPIPLLVPCHRVVGSRGQLGGFSPGLEWKRRLLAIESATAKGNMGSGRHAPSLTRDPSVLPPPE